SRVSAGSGSPVASIAAPPKTCSSSETSSGSVRSTRTASAATSGPIPSPGRTTTRALMGHLPMADERVDGVWGNREVPPHGTNEGCNVAETWFPPRERAEGERSRLDSERREERVDVGFDLDDRAAVVDELRRLQPGAGDEHDDAVVLADLVGRDRRAQPAEGHAGGALAEY